MDLLDTPFGVTDWDSLEGDVKVGDAWTATSRTRVFGSARVRMVEYGPGYVADHWCTRGHILLVLSGSLTTQLMDGSRFTIQPGQSYQVGSDVQAHRSSSSTGARLFIVDEA